MGNIALMKSKVRLILYAVQVLNEPLVDISAIPAPRYA